MLGELHCARARTRLRKSEDGSPELRVPIQSSPGPDLGPGRSVVTRGSDTEARNEPRLRDGRIVPRLRDGGMRGVTGPDQSVTPSSRGPGGENIVNKNVNIPVKQTDGFLKMEFH